MDMGQGYSMAFPLPDNLCDSPSIYRPRIFNDCCGKFKSSTKFSGYKKETESHEGKSIFPRGRVFGSDRRFLQCDPTTLRFGLLVRKIFKQSCFQNPYMLSEQHFLGAVTDCRSITLSTCMEKQKKHLTSFVADE
mmetsp:Transcript_21164/g.29671  ORF Transcript_21164/g.29671 Transcript_21164/m.29671 type:complete len:135 (+) Transcript_21164:681-1085(+)